MGETDAGQVSRVLFVFAVALLMSTQVLVLDSEEEDGVGHSSTEVRCQRFCNVIYANSFTAENSAATASDWRPRQVSGSTLACARGNTRCKSELKKSCRKQTLTDILVTAQEDRRSCFQL